MSYSVIDGLVHCSHRRQSQVMQPLELGQAIIFGQTLSLWTDAGSHWDKSDKNGIYSVQRDEVSEIRHFTNNYIGWGESGKAIFQAFFGCSWTIFFGQMAHPLPLEEMARTSMFLADCILLASSCCPSVRPVCNAMHCTYRPKYYSAPALIRHVYVCLVAL